MKSSYFLCAILLASCASLEVDNIALRDGNALVPGPQTGLKYSLPMTQFEIDLSRRVVACKDKAGKKKMVLSNQAKVKPLSKDDPQRLYVIDPRSLKTWFNKAAFSVEYHSGSRQLKTINASVEDQSGPVILTAVKTAAGLGTLPSVAGGSNVLVCEAGLEAQVKAVDDQLEEVKKVSNQLDASNLRVKGMKAEIAKNSSPNLLNDLTIALTEQREKAEELRAEKAKYDELSKPLLITHEKIVWPKTSDEFSRDEVIYPSYAQLDKIADKVPFELDDNGKPKLDEKGNRIIRGATKLMLGLEISIKNQTEYARKISSTGTVDAAVEIDVDGIYYREPAKGRLVVKTSSAAGSKMVHNKPYDIAQLGFIDVLPISTQIFESAKFSAEFDKSGRLLKSGYEQTAAPSASFMPIAETFINRNRLKQAQDDADVVAEIARLENEKKLLELQNPPTPVETQPLEEQIVLTRADLALNLALNF